MDLAWEDFAPGHFWCQPEPGENGEIADCGLRIADCGLRIADWLGLEGWSNGVMGKTNTPILQHSVGFFEGSTDGMRHFVPHSRGFPVLALLGGRLLLSKCSGTWNDFFAVH
jgi:hypothetical protein